MRNFEEFEKYALANGWKAMSYSWRETPCKVFQIKQLDHRYIINVEDGINAFIEYSDSDSILKDGLTVTELKTLIKIFGKKVAE